MRPGLGIRIGSEAMARRFRQRGIIIVAVTRGGAAAKSGLKGLSQRPGGVLLGDVIIAIDGKRVTNPRDLFKALDTHNVGDSTVVTILRDNKQLDLKVQLQDIGPQ